MNIEYQSEGDVAKHIIDICYDWNYSFSISYAESISETELIVYFDYPDEEYIYYNKKGGLSGYNIEEFNKKHIEHLNNILKRGISNQKYLNKIIEYKKELNI